MISNKNNKNLSETTKKVFFNKTASNSRLSFSFIKLPSCLFLPTIITVKGLYPPLIQPNITPTKSLSVPVKLLTMTQHYDSYNTVPMKKSNSLPIKSTLTDIPPPPLPPAKKLILKKKPEKKSIIEKKTIEKEEEEDEPMRKPLTITEKRKRQAQRADQVKIWKVREEREARQERLLIRRQMVNGTFKKATESTTIKKKKKRVKFDFNKNSIIQLPTLDDSDNDQNT